MFSATIKAYSLLLMLLLSSSCIASSDVVLIKDMLNEAELAISGTGAPGQTRKKKPIEVLPVVHGIFGQAGSMMADMSVSGRLVRVREGDALATGYRIDAISKSQVTIRKGRTTHSLSVQPDIPVDAVPGTSNYQPYTGQVGALPAVPSIGNR